MHVRIFKSDNKLLRSQQFQIISRVSVLREELERARSDDIRLLRLGGITTDADTLEFRNIVEKCTRIFAQVRSSVAKVHFPASLPERLSCEGKVPRLDEPTCLAQLKHSNLHLRGICIELQVILCDVVLLERPLSLDSLCTTSLSPGQQPAR
jgi:hypothetical protein